MSFSGALAWRVYADPAAPAVAHVRTQDGDAYYPLDRDRTIEAAGPLGITDIVIERGAVRVVDSPCPSKICVHTGAVDRTGAQIACLPNRVLVTVEGRLEKSYDAESH
ncbi:MAG: NusG domain II-containing protein [Spirochaetales bacterium]|nr:NusG domain II-containing protein [Spirochaetales bacterium]